MLRLGGHLLGAAAGTVPAPARRQARQTAGDAARSHRLGQYRLHLAPAGRHRYAGHALDRTGRPDAGISPDRSKALWLSPLSRLREGGGGGGKRFKMRYRFETRPPSPPAPLP
ncbi:protein of unknown function [Cupriavidus taiwanensis]|uniref:Glycolate oxidase, iron-sulfur subunit n=1 Tax=Cupriavidus taiwanensis TaxID=164546 RepID=A0A375FVH1_9BURK